jgi:hypothetical protein
MIGVTAICLLSALAANFPEFCADVAMIALQIAPTAAACAISMYFARDRYLSLIACAFGVFFGLLLVPGIMVSFDDWQTFIHSYALVTFPPALCAGLLGCIARMVA